MTDNDRVWQLFCSMIQTEEKQWILFPNPDLEKDVPFNLDCCFRKCMEIHDRFKKFTGEQPTNPEAKPSVEMKKLRGF
jgi:hypothetical protein